MRLTRIDVESLPGLTGRFTLEPMPGINVIVGPNTSGKSSLVRAIDSLLWPTSTPGAARHILTARFADAGGVATVSRRADGALVWTRDGSEVPPPRLPSGLPAAGCLAPLGSSAPSTPPPPPPCDPRCARRAPSL